MTNQPVNSLTPYLEMLPKLANYVVGFTLLCYAAGFAISNMFLGSFGVVKLDILQARYVLAGLLFALFLGAIAYLIFDLLRTIRAGAAESNAALLKAILWTSLRNLSTLIVVISAVAVLAGSRNMLPVGFPRLVPKSSAANAFGFLPGDASTDTALLLAAGCLVLLVVGFVVQRRAGALKAIQTIIILIAVTYITLLLINYLAPTEEGREPLAAIGNDDWRRYWAGIAFIYALVAVFLTVNVLLRRAAGDPSSLGTHLPALSPALYLAAMAVAIIVIMPLYANRIYPALPQQVGGGQVISIESIITDEATRSAVLKSPGNIYLIDRTGNATLLLLADSDAGRYQVVEIPNIAIKSIIYKSVP